MKYSLLFFISKKTRTKVQAGSTLVINKTMLLENNKKYGGGDMCHNLKGETCHNMRDNGLIFLYRNRSLFHP